VRKRDRLCLATMVSLCGFVSLSFGQVPIKIRLINAGNGRAIRNQPISVSLLYDKNEKAPPKYDATLHLESETNGKAQFVLPEPAPAHLSAQVHLTSKNWRCGCVALVATVELIQRVIAVPQTVTSAKSADKPIETEPKQIIFFARPMTFFERLVAPLVRE
jgi:hypothetical protein